MHRTITDADFGSMRSGFDSDSVFAMLVVCAARKGFEHLHGISSHETIQRSNQTWEVSRSLQGLRHSMRTLAGGGYAVC